MDLMPGTWCSIEGGPPVVSDRLRGPCLQPCRRVRRGGNFLGTDLFLQCLALWADFGDFGNQYTSDALLGTEKPDSKTQSKGGAPYRHWST
jgi:hypothetical protein